MRKVMILSGPGGCGKSTWAKRDHPDAIVCSADHYFACPETGEYKFDPTKLAIAHSNCLNKFLNELRFSEGDIVVDNTNISHWERQNYVDAAQIVRTARGEAVEIEVHTWQVETVREIWTCAKRNSHGVSVEIVAKMALNHEISPGPMHKIED